MRTQSKAAHLEHQVPKRVSEIFADSFGNGGCSDIWNWPAAWLATAQVRTSSGARQAGLARTSWTSLM